MEGRNLQPQAPEWVADQGWRVKFQDSGPLMNDGVKLAGYILIGDVGLQAQGLGLEDGRSPHYNCQDPLFC